MITAFPLVSCAYLQSGTAPPANAFPLRPAGLRTHSRDCLSNVTVPRKSHGPTRVLHITDRSGSTLASLGSMVFGP